MNGHSRISHSFYRPCWIEINTAALRANWNALQSIAGPTTRLLAVVKANAYGHGMIPAARVALAGGAVMLGVSSLEEGITLRASGVKAPVLILGSLFPFSNFPVLFRHRLTPTVASLEAARALSAISARRRQRLPVHLKVDSGFGRIGVQLPAAASFIRQVAALPGLVLEGVYTHFSSADADPSYTDMQRQRFQDIVEAAAGSGIRPRWIHMANSSAFLRDPRTRGTLARPGLAFYGVPPYAGASRDIALEPALSWKTRIIFLKMVPEGFPVSYARTWTAARPTRIATLAVGYADGYPRLLSNRGAVLIQGHRAPVIGRVTMDMMMADVTGIPNVHVGDEAVLIGVQGRQSLPAQALAESAQTNAYEILARIAERVPRVVR